MDPLFKKILCPIDYTDDSVAALKMATALARQNGALLQSVHVVPVAASDLGYPAAAYDRLRRLERKRLEETIRSSVPENFPCDAIVKIGNPAQEIIATAAELDVDLVVMATHGRAGVPRLVKGSVAERVIRESGRPVLVFRRSGS
jgi:universal stress protein A